MNILFVPNILNIWFEKNIQNIENIWLKQKIQNIFCQNI